MERKEKKAKKVKRTRDGGPNYEVRKDSIQTVICVRTCCICRGLFLNISNCNILSI